MKSKCCNRNLQLLGEIAYKLSDVSILDDSELYNTYRCSQCGLMYCLTNRKKLKSTEEIDEWE